MITVKERQLAREQKVVLMVEKFCPGLYFHSRAGGGIARTSLPRLRFDKHRFFGWFWRMFGAYPPGPMMIICGVGHAALDLNDGWRHIEIYYYDTGLSEALEQLANEYELETGCAADIFLEPSPKVRRWKPALRFFTFALVMATAVIAARLLSLNLLKNFFGI